MKRFGFLVFLFVAVLGLNAQTPSFGEQMQMAAQYGAESDAARSAGNIAQAIELRSKQIEIYETTTLTRFRAEAFHQQAVNYSLINKLDEAITCERKAVEIYGKEKSLAAMSAVCRSSLATFLYSRGHAGDIDDAYVECSEAIKSLKKKDASYVNTANLMVVLYTYKQELTKAKTLSDEIAKVGEKVYRKNTIHLANLLIAQAEVYARSGDLARAISIAKSSMAIYEQNEAQNSLAYGRLLVNTANYCYQLENYAGSLEMLEKALPILQQLQGTSGMDYNRCLTTLSTVHSRMGNIEKANDLSLQLSHGKAGGADVSIENAVLLSKQAEVSALNGDYNQAIMLQEEAKHIYVAHKDSVGVARCLTMVADYTNRKGNNEKAEALCLESIDILQRKAKESKDLANAFNTLSIVYNVRADYSAALDYSNKAADVCEHTADTVSTFYAQILNNMSIYSSALRQTDEAVGYASNAYRIYCNVLGENHPQVVSVLFNIASIYHQTGDRENLEKYFHKAVEMQKSIVRNNFTHLTVQERERYWEDRKGVFEAAPYFACQFPASSSLLADAYNSQLMTKGILLNSEIDFRTMLEKSGNTSLRDKYMRLFELNRQIDELFKLGDAESTQTAFQLQRKAELLEHDLMKNSKEFGDYTRSMAIGYKDIAEALGDEDVAVELLSVPQLDGSYIYFALYLRKGWDAPKGVFMFNSASLDRINHEGKNFTALLKDGKGAKYIFNSVDVGRMVWENLMHRLEADTDLPAVRNVYFSPSSLFYQWGIEYLEIDEGVRMCEKYNVYRLSSTKNIVQNETHQPLTTAAVFGGIDYDIDIELMRELAQTRVDFSDTQSRSFTINDNELLADNGDSDRSVQFEWEDVLDDDGETRGAGGAGFGYLPGTMAEASQIYANLREHGIVTFPVMAEEAIEENFKAMDGKHLTLLHIATHGFNFPEGSKSRKALDHFIVKPHVVSESESGMGYSGLIMAGSNNVFAKRIRMPKDIDDGILTSREIASLDLSGLELAVLSACQTGVGDIKGDGVFGLQRALKKAGARTLLMSLWNVNDRATQIMMSSFYGSMLDGASRHEAFIRAQQQLRSNGYDDPKFWAAFIMLDGL